MKRKELFNMVVADLHEGNYDNISLGVRPEDGKEMIYINLSKNVYVIVNPDDSITLVSKNKIGALHSFGRTKLRELSVQALEEKRQKELQEKREKVAKWKEQMEVLQSKIEEVESEEEVGAPSPAQRARAERVEIPTEENTPFYKRLFGRK